MNQKTTVDVVRNGKAAELAIAEQQRAEAVARAAKGTMVRKPQPYVPFPVDALPEPIRSYVIEKAAALGCDVAYVALPALAAATSLIGNTRVIELKKGWREPSVLWTALVADSGTLKTPAFNGAIGHLYAIQRRLLEKYERESAAYDRELEEWTVAAKRAKEQAMEPPKKPDRPKRQRVICSDITIETLVGVLQDNDRGTLVARDELAGWFGSFTRYKGKSGGSDMPLWLEAFGARPWIVDRKTGDRPSLFVPHAAVSVTGGIQPGVLASIITGEHLQAGLAARLLMAMPPKQPKHWSEVIVSPETETRYTSTLDALHQLGFADENGTKGPHALTLTVDAKADWIEFYEEWAAEQAAAHDEQAACLSKLEAYAARLALLHHVVTNIGLGRSDLCQIESASVAAGIELVRWFAYEAQRVYAMLAEDDDSRETRRLLEFIRSRDGEISAAELRRSNGAKYPTTTQAEAHLDDLVGKGFGAWTDRPPGPSGGRPTRVFRLLDSYYETYETSQVEEEQADQAADETP